MIKACKQRGLEALGVLIKIMETGKEANRLKAALAILERGYGKPQQPVVGKDGKDMFDKIEIVFVAAGVRENVD